MSEGNFYEPEAVKQLYGEIIPAYQAAFAGEPWYEVSKCADKLQPCIGGMSSLAVGSMCELCGNCLVRPAYETDELVDLFDSLGATRPTAWYVEQNGKGVTLAAIAWEATAELVAGEKYGDVPEMREWLATELGDGEIIWLDEVFANKAISPSGNLRSFGKLVRGLAEMLGAGIVAYRTIEPRMLAAAERDFCQSARILRRDKDVPDRRDFAIINLEKEKR